MLPIQNILSCVKKDQKDGEFVIYKRRYKQILAVVFSLKKTKKMMIHPVFCQGHALGA